MPVLAVALAPLLVTTDFTLTKEQMIRLLLQEDEIDSCISPLGGWMLLPRLQISN
jgi:hypothetical protein